MKKLILSALAVLGVAVSIFGGYFYYGSYESGKTEPNERHGDENSSAGTDNEVPFQRRGGAWLEEDGLFSSIPPNVIADALAQRQNYFNSFAPTDGFGDDGDAAGTGGIPTNWLPRGPQNLGGRTEAIVLHPNTAADNDSGTMWAGGSTGGVWKSFDLSPDTGPMRSSSAWRAIFRRSVTTTVTVGRTLQSGGQMMMRRGMAAGTYCIRQLIMRSTTPLLGA